MGSNLIVEAKSLLNEEVVNNLGAFLGENTLKVKQSLIDSIGTSLGILLWTAQDSTRLQTLVKELRKGGFDGSMVSNLESVLKGGPATSGILDTGKRLIKTILESKTEEVYNFISKNNSIGKSSSEQILSIAVVYVLNLIAKQESNTVIREDNIASLLEQQESYIQQELPKGMADILELEFGTIEEKDPVEKISAVVSQQLETHNAQVKKSEVVESKNDIRSFPFLQYLIPAAVVLVLGYFGLRYWLNDNQSDLENEKIARVDESEGLLITQEQKEWENSVGLILENMLTEGQSVNGEVISFQKLKFESESYTIVEPGLSELQDLAKTLINHPEVSAEFMNYTSSSANPESDQILSEQRAYEILKVLTNMGVQPNQISSIGMGSLINPDGVELNTRYERTELRIIRR